MANSKSPKAGDYVRFHTMPDDTDNLPADSQRVLEFCLGRVYRVEEVDNRGLLVLDVRADIDDQFGGFMNDIRVEPQCVTRVRKPRKRV